MVGTIFRDDRIVTTAGVAFEDGRYFLARRTAGGAQSRKWEFPGGKCDAGDSDVPLCLIREIQEELGIPIQVGQEIGAVPFENGSARYMLVGYAIQLLARPDSLSVHSETGWFLPQELPDLDLADSDRTFIERYILPGTR